ncbi:MAG: CD1845 family protein [Tissierellia bacterium]|nr:CD1845 family protein [Tissierellia bacterium]
MRWIIKIILFPISLLLSILTAFLTFLLSIGTALLYLLMMFCIFGAIASFLQKEVTIGIEALIIGFLVSPYGIPIVGAAVIAFLQGINEAIKSI